MSGYGPEVVLDEPAFIHPTVLMYGRVRIGRGASVWPYTVMRAEHSEIVVGEYSNIQDFTMIHVGYTTPTIIGARCSVTHHCTVHGATLGENCLIGINATIMDGCTIGANSIVAGGSFLKENTEIPPNSIVMGMPGRVVRVQDNAVPNRFNAALYHRNAEAYAAGDHRTWAAADFDVWAAAEMVRIRTAAADAVE